jgi:hypothetical protein
MFIGRRVRFLKGPSNGRSWVDRDQYRTYNATIAVQANKAQGRWEKAMLKAVAVLIPSLLSAVMLCGVEEKADSHPTRFSMAWENNGSWEDEPEFSDKGLDDPSREVEAFAKKGVKIEPIRRFTPRKTYGDEYRFKDGHFDIDLKKQTGEKAARIVAEAMGTRLLGPDRKCWRITAERHTRFGWYAYIDWGSAEEKYAGHVLRLMVDLDRHIIWWMKCD